MKIFIFGTGTIAEVAYSYLKNSKDFHIHGFVEFEKHLKSKKKFGLPIIKFENIEESLPSSDFKGFQKIFDAFIVVINAFFFELLEWRDLLLVKVARCGHQLYEGESAQMDQRGNIT